MGDKAKGIFVGCCYLDLLVENSRSLKDKRRVIKSIKEKLRNHYNVAVCEYGDLSLWQRAQLAIVTCANDKSFIDSKMKTLIEYLNKFHSVLLLNYNLEIY